MEVLTFDGNILHWQSFLDRFVVALHDRTNLKKLVYLEHAEENGSAKNAIKGLSHTGDQYMEAIDCLNGQYS